MSAAAPHGWEVEIADVSIGTLAPELTDFQVYADPDSGVVTAVRTSQMDGFAALSKQHLAIAVSSALHACSIMHTSLICCRCCHPATLT